MLDVSRIRAENLKRAFAARFRPAEDLPLRGASELAARSAGEVVCRLCVLYLRCMYVQAPMDRYPEGPIRLLLEQRDLKRWLAKGEQAVFDLPREDAREKHGPTIGWAMEQMVPLAWALGAEVELGDSVYAPSGDAHTRSFKCAPRDVASFDQKMASAALRPLKDIVRAEDFFYLLHNAAREAQFAGEDCVPDGFDPMFDGGIVHERRHGLTWMLSPGVSWDETDLST